MVLFAGVIYSLLPFTGIKAICIVEFVVGIDYYTHHDLLYKELGTDAMNGPYSKLLRERLTHYRQDGSVDWLQTIVRTVVVYKDDDAVYIESTAAQRAQAMYYKRGSYERK